ncbi:MAG: DNA adenine methylase [Planctomycetia bacterium]|nr:DNA adenine methylase [Planctomycetia bacterium]
MTDIPHPFPYQGSKRKLAARILAYLPARAERLVEPFAGSAAVTLAAARQQRARRFLLNDLHAPLTRLWHAILHAPEPLADDYEALWTQQQGQERAFFDRVRDDFNRSQEPHCLLYLLARCVKAAVRYNASGEFNNSPDNRRLGMRPAAMRRNLLATASLLHDNTEVQCRDYREVLAEARPGDVVYLDPPYQGVTESANHRYCQGLRRDDFAAALDDLNRRGIPFLVSYDGRTGDKVHGQPLPAELKLHRIELPVGRSSQATLLGKDEATVESLYLSASIHRCANLPP